MTFDLAQTLTLLLLTFLAAFILGWVVGTHPLEADKWLYFHIPSVYTWVNDVHPLPLPTPVP